MGHSELLQHLERLMPEIWQSGDPEATLLKFANARNLAPAQLERMAQLYNTAKTINFMDKSANRGGTFTVINTPDLLTRYTQPASPAGIDSDIPQGIRDWIDLPAQKQASHRPPNVMAIASGESLALPSVFDAELAELEKQAAFEHAEQVSAAELKHEISLLQQIAFDHQELARTELEKFANTLQEQGFDMFAEVDEDVQKLLGEEGENLMKIAADYCTGKGFAIRRWIPNIKKSARVARDRHTMVPLFKRAKDALDMAKSATALAVDQSKKLKTEPRVSKNPGRGKGDKDYPGEKGKKTDWIGELGGVTDAGVNSLQRHNPSVGDVRGIAGSILSDIAPGTNGEQRQVDEALDDDKAMTTLHRLMLTDPIISEADPDEVAKYFNTIRAHSPSVAADPNILALTLREALQYQGVPTHSVKELADLHLVHQKTRKEDSDAAHRRYDTNTAAKRRE